MTQHNPLSAERFKQIGDQVDLANFTKTGPLADMDFGALLSHVMHVHGIHPTIPADMKQALREVFQGNVGVSSNDPEVLEELYSHINALKGHRVSLKQINAETEAARPKHPKRKNVRST